MLNGNEFSIIPQGTIGYNSDHSDYAYENLPLWDFEIGSQFHYASDKLKIKFYLAYHLIDGTLYLPSDFTPSQGLHYTPSDPGLSNQRNYYIADLNIAYGDSSLNFYVHRGNQHWGFGKRSLTLSDKIPSFVHGGLNWEISPKLKYSYLHGSLKSGIEEESENYYWDGEPYNPPDLQRNIAGHRLQWSPNHTWDIAFSELVIYGNRSIEWGYAVPLLPFFPVQGYLGDSDNILMSADVLYKAHSKLNIYGSFLMDEWSPPYTFKEDNRNWFGWQVGLQFFQIFSKEINSRFEYNWTDHRIYRHRFSINDAYSWQNPVGFWAGPHAEEFFLEVQTSMYGNQIHLQYSVAKRGELTQSMLVDQYNRPNNSVVFERYERNELICNDCYGTTEKRNQLIIAVQRNLFSSVTGEIYYSFLQWDNAGFNASSPLEETDLPDFTKHSLGIEITYRLQ